MSKGFGIIFDSRVNEHAASLIENMHAETVTYFNLSPSNEYLRGYLIAESSLLKEFSLKD